MSAVRKVIRIDDAGNPIMDPKSAPTPAQTRIAKAKQDEAKKGKDSHWTEMYPVPVIHPDDARVSEEEWNWPAADNKGHSAKLQVRVPPAVAREIEIIFQSKKFPYLTQEDLLRMAVIRLIYTLHRWDGSMPRTVLASMDAAMRSAKDLQTRMAIREFMDDLRQCCVELAEENAFSEIRQRCLAAKHYLDQCPQDSVWTKKARRELREITTLYLAQQKMKVLQPSNSSILSLPAPDDE